MLHILEILIPFKDFVIVIFDVIILFDIRTTEVKNIVNKYLWTNVTQQFLFTPEQIYRKV